jgi:hypothetical protein
LLTIVVAQVLGAFQQLQLMSMDNLTDDERIALLTEMSQATLFFALLCCSFCALPAFGLLILRPTESTRAYPVGT